jgi:pimeloyl-ACP methyl ester carboxylesterase
MTARILFLADNHYDTHGGKALYDSISSDFDITFFEDDYLAALNAETLDGYDLLMTCAIGGTPGAAHAPKECSPAVKAFLEAGKPLFLFHGGSATFWEWDWWREAVGLRWVRPNDPDGVEPSTHPVIPFELKRSKSRHPLLSELRDISVPKDELYIKMETTRPILPLLEVSYEGVSYPMAYASKHQWGGDVMGFLPGHAPAVVQHPDVVANIRVMLKHLLK